MRFQTKKLGFVVLVAFLSAGCAMGDVMEGDPRENYFAKNKKKKSEPSIMDEAAWIPLGLSRESFRAAEKRLSKSVQIGMSRREFLFAMKLNPAIGAEWSNRITAGDGWFSELSMKNQYGGLEIEEFVFGYYDNHRLNERFAVILENGRVTRIIKAPRFGGSGPSKPPSKVFSKSIDIEEETQLIRSHYQKNLQTQAAFEKILPQLKRIRAGWTSAEVRISLGGSLYRMPNGLTYLQEGLLWDDGFIQNGDGASSIVIMPFGYRDEKGKIQKKVVVRAESGVVTAVFWKSDTEKEANLKKE